VRPEVWPIALAALATACASRPPAARPSAPKPAPTEAPRGPGPTADLTAVTQFGCEMDCHGSVPAALAAALRERASGAKGCFDDALHRNPALHGRLLLRLQITGDGFVCATAVDDHGLGDAELKRCVLSLFRGQRFSAPSGGCVNIAFPLRFVVPKPDAGAAPRDAGAG
jgi:hypothetical protein